MSRRDQRNNSPKGDAHRMAQEKWDNKQKHKQQTLIDRQGVRTKRSDEDQVALLDKKFGIGIGAKKERARLEARINSKKETK